MPARLLTPSSIWNSFLSSNKRHIVITGGRGAGKTTLLSSLFPDRTMRGITTYARAREAVYLRENLTENTVVVGLYDDSLQGNENKMRPCITAFEEFGVNALERLCECEDEWVTVDEIGYLETVCSKYCEALVSLMEKKRVAAVVRKQSVPFLESICGRSDVFLIDLDDPFGEISCVIMASGMGKRFGGNKLMADFNGKPMILRAIDATDGIFKKRVVVTRHEEVARLCRECGAESVLHSYPYRSDTVRLGVEAVVGAESCMFCSGDQPLLRKDTVMSLALAAKNSREDIWRASYEGAPGSPVVFPKWTFSELLSLPSGKGGGFVAKKYPECVRLIGTRDEYELMDADTPAELELLQKIY